MQSQAKNTLKMMGKAIADMPAFPYIMATGGDDRLVLDPKTGVNKYYCKPDFQNDVLFRGSCTCNLPTETAYSAAQNVYEKMKLEEESLPNVMQSIRE